ncbi:MFS transporter [Stenotrophomonas sp. MMGLT7]|uniref:MFS transporter n=1 Tax=Stenotrophomonas sp. MMGLT7 TaxID=2901227 RepID=UPI001E29600F|nr:MFS transporter [Stenotrophomonas sp. MMGLT7]MCD7098791.1 MFS transporter [Stenotrophomonas sp. MMGLT7]
MSLASQPAATAASPSRLKPMLVAAAAVALEGYDLAIYALFASTMAEAFFPTHDPTSSLLLAVGALGVGYLMRPLGGLVLGRYADRKGRKAALALTVLLMSLSTGAIGLVPTYGTIGLAAPVLVVLARLVQGFSAGGAAAGSIAYLSESAPPHRRGFFASWQQAAQMGSFLLSAGIAAIVSARLGSGGEGHGWRLPFLLALVLGPLSLYIRRYLPDPEVFLKERAAAPEESLGKAIGSNARAIAVGFGLSCLWNIAAFILLFFMPTFAQRQFGIPLADAFQASVIGGAVVFVLCPLVGWWSDRVGRRLPMLLSALGLLATIYPLLAWLGRSPVLGTLVVVQAVLGVMIAGYTAPVSALLAELFPTRSRSIGLSVAYNLSTLLLGSFGPLIVTWLIAVSGNPLAPAFYVMAGAMVSSVALAFSRDRTGQALEDPA